MTTTTTTQLGGILGVNAEYLFITINGKPDGRYYMLAPIGPWNITTALADAQAETAGEATSDLQRAYEVGLLHGIGDRYDSREFYDFDAFTAYQEGRAAADSIEALKV